MLGVFDNLGAGILLKDLHATRGTLGSLDVSGSEPELTSLAEQVSDLIDIVSLFDQLATKERRHPSVHIKFRSPNTLLHLRAVLDSTVATIYECYPFVRPLQSSLETIKRERTDLGYITHENSLETQPWYDETYQAIRVLAELLRALFTAIDLLQYQDDPDEDTVSQGAIFNCNSITLSG